MKRFSALAVCVILIWIAGCTKEGNPVDGGPFNNPTVIMPLVIGNEWTYASRSLDTAGQVTGTDTATFKIVRDTTMGVERWYFIGRDSGAWELLTNRSDGLWYTARVSGGIRTPVLLAKYPAFVNDTFYGLDSVFVTVVSTSTPVTVPAGSFTCYEYREDPPPGGTQVSRFFPPGKGFVRDDFRGRTPGGQSYLRSQRNLVYLVLRKEPGGASGGASAETRRGAGEGRPASWLMPLR
ncbi:MAG: hypothetical protein WB626_06035 [Bacteroidota bacterium]